MSAYFSSSDSQLLGGFSSRIVAVESLQKGLPLPHDGSARGVEEFTRVAQAREQGNRSRASLLSTAAGEGLGPKPCRELPRDVIMISAANGRG